MSRRTAGIVAWSLFGVCTVLGLTGLGLTIAVRNPFTWHFFANVWLGVAIFFVAGTIGALIASRLPSNPIGWIFLGLVAALGLSSVADGYASLAVDDGHTGGLVRWAAWYESNMFVALLATLLYSLLLFPDGRLPSRRWRPVFWAGTAGIALVTFSVFLGSGDLNDYPQVESPLVVDSPLVKWAFVPGFILFSAALVGAAASVVVRFRRARGVERQQLTLLVAAGSAAAAIFVVSSFLGSWITEDLGIALTLLGVLAVPVAMGAAMLRYRLYEVDRVISKTLVYGALTVILVAAYAALVLAGQAVFSSFAGGSNLAIAVSTLVVAALFLPLRARVQRVVDRRFYRRRYDAQRTLERFGARLREQVEIDGLDAELQDVVRETMQPAHVSLWLRGGVRP